MNQFTKHNLVEDVIWSRQAARRIERVAESTRRTSRGVFRVLLSVQKQIVAFFLAIMMVVANAGAFVAFEAHIVNVTAEVRQIDPPVITPPGQTYGSSTLQLTVSDSDIDALYLY